MSVNMELAPGEDKVHTVVCTAVLALMDMMVAYTHSLKINLHLEYECDQTPHQNTITLKHCLVKEAQTDGEANAKPIDKPQKKDVELIVAASLKQVLKHLGERTEETSESKVTVDKLAADIGLDFIRQWDWPEGEEEAGVSEGKAGKYSCQVCSKTFTFATNLTRHEKKIHGIQPQPNKNYDVIVEPEKVQEQPKKEAKQSEKPETFKCSMCEREFPLYQNLGRHLQKAHKVRVVEQEMKSGDVALHGTGDFVCSLCGHRFSFQSNLSRHFAKVHKRCPKAKRHKAIMLASPEGRNRNKPAKKNDRARHKCDQCGCRFTFRSNLNRHMNKVHRKRSPLRTLRSGAGNGNVAEKDKCQDKSPQSSSSLQPSEVPSTHSTIPPPPASSHIHSPSPNQNSAPTQNSPFQTPVNHWNSRQNPHSFPHAQSISFPSQAQFASPYPPAACTSSEVVFTSPTVVYSGPSYTSPGSQTSPYAPLNSTPTSMYAVLKTSPYTSPAVAYTPTQQISPMSQISPMTHVSPYASPLNQSSSSFADQSSSLLQPSPLGPRHQASPPFFHPLSTSSPSPSVYQHVSPQITSSAAQNGFRAISPVIIRPIVSTASPSPTHSEMEKRGSVTPTGPLSPLVPPPDLEISSQVSPSHALAPPVPLSAPSPEPPSHNVPLSAPAPVITYPVAPPIRPSIPTSFSIPHLSSNHLPPPASSPRFSASSRPPSIPLSSLPLSPPSVVPSLSLSAPPRTLPLSTSSLPPSLALPTSSLPHSLPLSSALPPALSVPHLSSPTLPAASHLLSLVHNAPVPLLHNAPAILPSSPPPAFLPRSCRKFSCSLCSALFSFESNAKRHFLSQHTSASKDVPMFQEIMIPVPPPPTTTATTTSTTTTSSKPATSTKATKTVKSPGKSKACVMKKETVDTKSKNPVETKATNSSSVSVSKPKESSVKPSTAQTSKTTPKSETNLSTSSKSLESNDKTPPEIAPKSKENSMQRNNAGRSNGKSRRFVCEKCPATYTFRTNLTRHMRQKHGGVE